MRTHIKMFTLRPSGFDPTILSGGKSLGGRGCGWDCMFGGGPVNHPPMSLATEIMRRLEFETRQATASQPDASQSLIVISSERGARGAPLPLAAQEMVGEALRLLRPGGLLFIYGAPEELALWGEHLLATPELAAQIIFKYWIALDLNEQSPEGFLRSNHQGLLLFARRDPARKTSLPFPLQVQELRIPHRNCTACGQNVKDWGGKKHLLNPLGAAPSDVWRDLPRRRLTDGVIPDDVLRRLVRLSGAPPARRLHLIAAFGVISKSGAKNSLPRPVARMEADQSFTKLSQIELNQVYAGDCVSFLHRVEVLHPNGLFDLAFADPPYNLEKKYGQWDDALADQHYLDWCNAWLDGMAATLKPGGSLFVLNLPKWAVRHAAFLSQRLDFRHWIVWDALSDPRGKLMPAHYALLWYTKPGGKPVCNYSPIETKARPGFVVSPDSLQYCLRAKCVHQRKALGDDAKVELSDFWSDIHRIKHKRDRDAHPCQLPEKLMERIIKLATRPGGVVFDPFCGAGTTAIAALKHGRQFVVTDVDQEYVRITNEKITAMHEHADMFGEFVVPRIATTRHRGDVTKREIESYLQQLAHKLERVPTEADVLGDRPGLLQEIDRIYPNRGAAFKRAKIGL